MSTEETTDVQDAASEAVIDESVPERILPDDAVLRAVMEPVESAVLEGPWDDVIRIDKDDLAAFGSAARDGGFEMCVDVTAVDYKGIRRTRFEVVVNFISHQHNRRLRVLTAVPEGDAVVPSLVSLYPGTNFFEREVYDMFGIGFDGHPDLTRILMPDDWVGYPLRKDFGVGSVPVQFKESHRV